MRTYGYSDALGVASLKGATHMVKTFTNVNELFSVAFFDSNVKDKDGNYHQIGQWSRWMETYTEMDRPYHESFVNAQGQFDKKYRTSDIMEV